MSTDNNVTDASVLVASCKAASIKPKHVVHRHREMKVSVSIDLLLRGNNAVGSTPRFNQFVNSDVILSNAFESPTNNVVSEELPNLTEKCPFFER